MTPETKRKLIILYRNLYGGGRVGGAPFSLGDLLSQVPKFRALEISMEKHADAIGDPIEFVQDLYAAYDEGVTPEEMEELSKLTGPTWNLPGEGCP